jgi:hypothetical protein
MMRLVLAACLFALAVANNAELTFENADSASCLLSFDGSKINSNCDITADNLVGKAEFMDLKNTVVSKADFMGLKKTVDQLKTDVEYLKRRTDAPTQRPTNAPTQDMDSLSSCEARYQAGERTSGQKTIKVAGASQTVFCDQENYGGGWTLVMKHWGTNKPDAGSWKSNSAVHPDACRNVPSYSGPGSGAEEKTTCKMSDTWINNVKTSTARGRIRGDWKGDNSDKTGHGRVAKARSCSNSRHGGHSWTCGFDEHGFGSGSCSINSAAKISLGGNCDQCLAEGDTDSFARDAFPASKASSWAHGNTYGWMCGFRDGWDGIATGYAFDSVRRSVVSGWHHGDTSTDRIDFRVWVR